MANDLLPDLDRRTMANLPYPRNIAELTQALREDPNTSTRSEEVVAKHVQELIDGGLVVGLGTFESSSDLVSKAQSSKSTIEMADEQCQILERRLKMPSLQWRLPGEQFMLAEKGLERIKEPVVDSRPLSQTSLRNVIETEARRVVDHDPEAYSRNDGPNLSSELSADEFDHWLKIVLDEHEQSWGERSRVELQKSLRLPMQGGAGYTDTYESTLIDAENQKTTLTAAAPWFMALTILAFTDTDTGTTADNGSHIPTYTGYARKSVAAADMGSAASGSASNANAITFAACTAGSSVIVGFGNCDAGTVGLLRKYGTASSTTVSTTQTPAQFAVGAYTTSID
jgi:hypothetical protein